ncbi:putative Ig domain-containing protein [Actinoplanes sp. N902-109]|uniref:putative Ig domain-containing protein n=1 Tax=Actinoplanes sp. (strain N902-109) TaxID=649831 RepID=UPI0003293AC9|nr:putative Ig domain-containing protein [Actinoplanes sp. N902-109]AGL14717.1 PKD domain containing protein [Actinoplanes sp. N902-109]
MGRRRTGDDGFSLLEVLVAMAVIGTVMAGAAPFLVRSLAVVGQQRGTQVAIQVANDALERVRAIDPASLTTGRGLAEVTRQNAAAPAEVQHYLATMNVAADPNLADSSTAGASAPLPTQPLEVTSNGTTFQEQWYVGKCYQLKATAVVQGVATVPGCAPLSAEPSTSQLNSLYAPFYRVVVSVAWPDKFCTDARCLYVASTLISTGNDAVFDTKSAAPTITPKPAAQRGYVGDTVSLQLGSSGGSIPLTWSATGLPAGLTVSPTGLVSGSPTTAGTSTVTAKVTDKLNRNDTVTFTWTVAAVPVLTNPGTQTSRTGTALTFQPVLTGGIGALTWTMTGLPAGLTYSTTTGLITGTPTTAKTGAVVVTVTDSGPVPRTATMTFSWQVLTPVQLYDPGPQTMTNGTNVGTFTPYAYGGLTPYRWQVTNLPDGAVMDPSTGKVTGIITHGSRYLTTVTVTDAAGGVATLTVMCTVNPSSTTDLQVTAPTAASQSTATGTAVSVRATATGANASAYAWSATGLPPGLSITASTGLITGSPTTKGTWTVRLTVKSTGTTQANSMFVWSVT